MMSEILKGFTGITLNNIGKKFRDQWIFKHLTLDITHGEKIAITGHNGSGKSTFLQLLSGYIHQSEGTVTWKNTNGPIPVEQVHKYVSLASPYMDLIEDFTLQENIDFYSRYKKLKQGISIPLLIEKAGLQDARHKAVKDFSSGMKQRCKLAMAFMADTPLLLLDEPLSNLDESGYKWYNIMVSELLESRTVILCSNQLKEETFFCTRFINIEDYR